MHSTSQKMPDRSALIQHYFLLGFSYDEITGLLAQKHNIFISVGHLKRLLQRMELFRRKSYTDIIVVAEFIQQQLRRSGGLHGYRWMHLKCVQRGLNIPKETIREPLDPRGVEIRLRRKLKRRLYSAKRPNYLWHVDSYDKLTPYGICINPCIDGFPRKIIWPEAGMTNSDPRIIAGYFLEAVLAKNGTPRRTRGDMGTEHIRVAHMQQFLRETGGPDGRSGFIYGTS